MYTSVGGSQVPAVRSVAVRVLYGPSVAGEVGGGSYYRTAARASPYIVNMSVDALATRYRPSDRTHRGRRGMFRGELEADIQSTWWRALGGGGRPGVGGAGRGGSEGAGGGWLSGWLPPPMEAPRG